MFTHYRGSAPVARAVTLPLPRLRPGGTPRCLTCTAGVPRWHAPMFTHYRGSAPVARPDT